MKRSWLALWLVLVLLGTTAGAVVAGHLLDRQPRQVSAAVRDYFAALERERVEEAMGHITPARRPEARDFVAHQQGNRFAVEAVSVRAPSLLERLGGRPSTASSATVFVHVNPGTQEAWRTVTLVPLERQDGRWYFARPPLAPPGD